jgi:phosphoribosyl-AMP cyclohydrolase
MKPNNLTGNLNQEEFLQKVKFDANGLVPAIAQSSETGEVLMLAYMNYESILKTIESKLACYWSRSRQAFWTKGESSGHLQHIEEILLDCDGDTILLKVKQIGPACHTGQQNCFFRKLV